MSSENLNDGSKMGVLGGTLVAILGNLPVEKIWKTVILAIIGAVASYVATLVCRYLWRWLQRLWQNKSRKGR